MLEVTPVLRLLDMIEFVANVKSNYLTGKLFSGVCTH